MYKYIYTWICGVLPVYLYVGYNQTLVCLSDEYILDERIERPFHCKLANNHFCL